MIWRFTADFGLRSELSSPRAGGRSACIGGGNGNAEWWRTWVGLGLSPPLFDFAGIHPSPAVRLPPPSMRAECLRPDVRYLSKIL